jgi:hypothetical protein
VSFFATAHKNRPETVQEEKYHKKSTRRLSESSLSIIIKKNDFEGGLCNAVLFHEDARLCK